MRIEPRPLPDTLPDLGDLPPLLTRLYAPLTALAGARVEVLTAVVAFVTNARSAGEAPRKAASSFRALSMRSSISRHRKRTGSRSISSRSRACSASTGRGQAPKEP